MKKEVLKLLKETDGFLSGQDICGRLSVSRTAVWKVINQLRDEGYRIEAARNKGYRLSESADVITEAELLSCLESRWCGRSVYYFQETDSTNIRAKQLAEEGALHGSLVIADSQTAGRGRRGRIWISDPGTGIWMSLILRPEFLPSSASMLTLIAALAVRAGVKESTGLDLRIKWPNDLLCDGKKLCGILTEMSAEMDHIHYVVVGIGINVNMTEIPEEIKETAVSLRLLNGGPLKRSKVAAEVIKSFESYYGQFLEAGDLTPFLEEYHAYLAGYQEMIRVIQGSHEYEGMELGIDRAGGLKVGMADGIIKTLVSGEVSIRASKGHM